VKAQTNAGAKQSATIPPTDLNPRSDAPLDFPDRELGELSAKDYDELGFLCGLEVHQQLLTRTKLFCRCPAGRRVRAVDAEVLRHMRPTLSELGEYDGCALMEFKTRKEIIYQLSRSCVCTYEMDDTPPFEIDEEAVRIALEIALLFDQNLVSELHVMRKQYLDGSIPTGFQRTAMVGLGGTIPFRDSELGGDRLLRIRQLSLEEDSCREVSDIGHTIRFRTDRLGMPLIETVTEPDLLTPGDVRAGMELLAAVARSSGKVRRGPGAARQDVNVSIAGSRRVEIKGVSSGRLLPALVHNEAYRHLNLLRIKAELERRGVTPDVFSLPAKGMPWELTNLVVDAHAAVRHSAYDPVQAALADGDTVCAIKLPGFGGLLAHPTQPQIPFAQELAERVRVIACLTSRPFLVSFDVEPMSLGSATWRHVRLALHAQDEDAILVVWGPPQDAATAAREILLRAQEALVGVPSETRQARSDATTGFERILPGPERMYPDTDTPPLPIPDAWIEAIELRERPWDRVARYEALGLSKPMAGRLPAAPWADLFDELVPWQESPGQLALGDDAVRLAHAFEKRIPRAWRVHGRRFLPGAERLRAMLQAGIEPSAIEFVLDELLREDADVDAVLERHRRRDVAVDALIDAERPEGLSDEACLRWAMRVALSKVPRGAVDPLEVRARVIERFGLVGVR